MPFWWRRRKRAWIPRNQYRRRRWTFKRRRRRRRPRRNRKTFRRRRRKRRYKVRRKKKQIVLKQWQPDSIVKCKIKGVGTLVLGAQGRQMVCYTNVEQQLTPPKAPCGGGFGCKQFSLGYLYREYVFRRNIWTKSNIAKELCRYLGVMFTFYRHPDFDFILNYDRQPPFDIDQWVYTQCHPLMLLLGKHKKLLLSQKTKPNGKLTKRIKIKPPKLMITKWFFSEDFSKFPLLMLRAAVCSFNYPNLGCCNTNQILTFFYLTTDFYKNAGWALQEGPQTSPTPYTPYPNVYTPVACWGKPWPSDKPAQTITENSPEWKAQQITIFKHPNTYAESIAYGTGWFCKEMLSAVALTQVSGSASPRSTSWGTRMGLTPCNTVRYNPSVDTGKGNIVWLKSTLRKDWDKPTDPKLYMRDMPLWLCMWGWLSFVQLHNKDKAYFETYIVCIESPAFYISARPVSNTIVVPLDQEFVNGKWPFDEPITHKEHLQWWPNVYHQLNILNQIACCGPYVPKYDITSTKNSTWELDYFYQFFFKWGGAEITDQPVTDPQTQGTYVVPDKYNSTIQIRDPAKQKFDSILHPWDYRRGLVKSSALKRMSSNLSIDSTFQPDGSPPKKKKITGPELTVPEEEIQEVQSCLLSLCEENIFQETPQTDLLQLIKQQQQQQQELKYNLLKLLSELKQKQRQLQLQTGLLN
nr:MAG: ORF1 [Torque teno midi virus]